MLRLSGAVYGLLVWGAGLAEGGSPRVNDQQHYT